MGRELPILPASAQADSTEQTENYVYSRVFCQKENSPPLRLLIDFLKARAQTPLCRRTSMTPPWMSGPGTNLSGYHRDRKPIQIFCVRDRGTYQDVFGQEQTQFRDLLTAYEDIEAQLALNSSIAHNLFSPPVFQKTT